MQFKNLPGLNYCIAAQRSLFNDCFIYLLLFRLWSIVEADEEEDDSLNKQVNNNVVQRVALDITQVS